MKPWLVPLGALLLAGCPTAGARRPTGPPPVYEKPVLPAWEAAAPANPLDNLAQGGWVDETGDEDAGDAAADAPADGATEAALAADAGASEAAGKADSGASRPGSRDAGPEH